MTYTNVTSLTLEPGSIGINPTSLDTLETYINLYDVIKIDKTGFYYKDEFIEDAGKAHKLLVKVLEGKCNCD